MNTKKNKQNLRLYHVTGVRHHAVILAESKNEAIALALDASEKDYPDARVLCGHVGSWESPVAKALALPKKFSIVQSKGRK